MRRNLILIIRVKIKRLKTSETPVSLTGPVYFLEDSSLTGIIDYAIVNAIVKAVLTAQNTYSYGMEWQQQVGYYGHETFAITNSIF